MSAVLQYCRALFTVFRKMEQTVLSKTCLKSYNCFWKVYGTSYLATHDVTLSLFTCGQIFGTKADDSETSILCAENKTV